MALSEEEYELWTRYLRRNDAEARDYLFLKYLPWARRVAGNVYARLKVPQLEWADFAQNAVVGMLEAMSRYDPDRGWDFMAYAKLRVQGAVFNGVRIYLTGVDRASRSERFVERLDSIADREEDPADPLTGFIDTVASLGLGFLLESVEETPSAQSHLTGEQSALRRRLLEAMESLGDRERVVMSAHYLDHVPFRDIAHSLKLTKGRISQIHKTGLAKLRERLLAMRLDPSDYL